MAKYAVKRPIAEVIPLANTVARALEKDARVQEAVLCGSIRRNLPMVGDVDITVFTDRQEGLDILNRLMQVTGGVVRCAGNKQATVFIDDQQFDLRFHLPTERGGALLHSTGSGAFNTKMRSQAKYKGFLLNQYGLWTRDRATLVASLTEQDIFTALGMKFVPPELRDLPVPKIESEFSVTIMGSTGTPYVVRKMGNLWMCQCKGFKYRNECRHIREVLAGLEV